MSQIFSSYDYYKNYDFSRLMRNWNAYLQSSESNELVLAEWEETLLKDFLDGARKWLRENSIWGEGLE